MRSRSPRTGHVSICTLAALAVCAPAWGTIVNYAVDPAQSSLTLSNSWLGMTMQPKSATSLITSYQGSIQADITNSSFQLITANLNADTSGSFSPASGGGLGKDSADYAGSYPLGWFGILGNVEVAFRDVALNLASAPLALTAGAFDASAAGLTAASGSMDYAGVGLLGWLAGTGQAPLAGSAANEVLSAGTVSQSGSTETVTIPIDATFSVKIDSPFLANQHQWFEVNLSGTIVATRTQADDVERPIPEVPEPATFALAMLGLTMMGFWRR